MTFVHKVRLFLVKTFLKLFIMLEYTDVSVRRIVRVVLGVVILSALACGVAIKAVETNFYPFFYVSNTGYEREFPELVNEIPFPPVTSTAVLVADVENDKILVDKNIREPHAPASTTKLMTSLIASELYDESEYLEVSKECADIEGTKLGLLPGEKVLVSDLLYSTLISSSNDSACVLAYNVKASGEDFIFLMNNKAKDLGLENTTFSNPIGLDGLNGSHVSTAYDLYLLAKAATENPFIKEAVKLKEFTVVSGVYPRKIFSTNYLLWAVPESVGIKTGKTEAAGEVLIYEYKDNDKDLIIVVMGSEDRFLDTRRVLYWLLESYTWK